MLESNAVGYLIAHIFRCSRRYKSKELDQYGLGRGTFQHLMALYRRDGVSQSELSDRVITDKANTTRSINKLIELGYVSKDRDSNDQRAVTIHLTDKALEIKPQIRSVLMKWTLILTKGLSKEEKETVRRLLKKMAINAENHINDSTETGQ